MENFEQVRESENFGRVQEIASEALGFVKGAEGPDETDFAVELDNGQEVRIYAQVFDDGFEIRAFLLDDEGEAIKSEYHSDEGDFCEAWDLCA